LGSQRTACSRPLALGIKTLRSRRTKDAKWKQALREISRREAITVLFLLEVFDDRDVPSLGVQAVHEQTFVSSQRRHQALQLRLPLLPVQFVVEVDRRGPPGQSELGAGAESKIGGQFSFDGGGALELVVDLDADAPPRLFELGRDVSRPLCSVSPDLSHL